MRTELSPPFVDPCGTRCARAFTPLFLLALAAGVQAQTLLNGSFLEGASGWGGCPAEINTAAAFGGSGDDPMAEIDGHLNVLSTADDRSLCQTISGFQVGTEYTLGFKATRRPNLLTPATVTANVTVDGGALSTSVSRSGGWNMAPVTFQFTATQATHTLRITPDFLGTFGMLIDDLALEPVSVLPVELMAFTATAGANTVDLQWTTASEQESAYFIVERSADNGTWSAVALLEAQGNSYAPVQYDAQDAWPVHGTSYYRLAQYDQDGSVEHSPARVVEWAFEGTALNVFPNPAKGVLHLRSPQAYERILVFDGMSRCVREGASATEFTMDGLPSGMYTVRMGTMDELFPMACRAVVP